MRLQKLTMIGSLTAMVMGGTLLGSGIAMAQQGGDTPGAEVLTRGPVHEAFAGTVIFDPEAGIIVDVAPPAMIEEVPPEQRLEGDNVAWIPGYWAWDEDQNDFLWISGIWRNLPPGREWIPGYWSEIEGRHQWTSGYWEDAETTTVSYLPKPPRSVESGPNIVATSNDQSWIPGNWVYRENRYAWRAGYWVAARPNWSWTPSYYRWTHRGYVYVDGYWDYPVVRRGVVFAPVHFRREYISRPDFYYSPATVIALSVFTNHLFLRPNYGHYYFGDYYEPRYRDRGFHASFSYNTGYRGYDPIYAHYRWENRNDRNWDRQRQDYFEYRRDHAESRPPRTWAALNARPLSDRERGDFGVADRFDRVVGDRGEGRQRFQAVNQKERERFVSQRQEIRKFGKERQQLETTGVSAKDADRDGARASSVKIDRSPVADRKPGRSNKDGGPPVRLQPRMSDESQGNGNASNKGVKEEPAKPKAKENAGREEQPRGNGKSEPMEETRTKPGQKRENEPRGKEKSEPASNRQQSNGETRTRPGQKREANPDSERPSKPAAKREATPTPKRQANPTPERQVSPTPKRQAAPTPERKANPTPKRQAAPTPERQANPTPKRQATPTPERKASPAPKRKAAPEPERKVKPAAENRESASARKTSRPAVTQRSQPKPTTKAQPLRQQTSRQQPQATRKATPSKPAVTQPQQKAKPASRPAATQEEVERRKKKQEAN